MVITVLRVYLPLPTVDLHLEPELVIDPCHEAGYCRHSNAIPLTIPAGSLGTVPGVGAFPPESVSINQGSSTFLVSETTLSQPTTQLLKIGAANGIARGERGIANAELRRSENDTVLAVHQLYYALLIACKEREAAQAMLAAAQETLKESEYALWAGNARFPFVLLISH